MKVTKEFLKDWQETLARGTGGKLYGAGDSDDYKVYSTKGPELGDDVPIYIVPDNNGHSKNGAGCGEDFEALILGMNIVRDLVNNELHNLELAEFAVEELTMAKKQIREGKHEAAIEKLEALINLLS